jgi:hypothetical protein
VIPSARADLGSKNWVLVGETFSTDSSKQAKQSFEYDNGSTSTIGVGGGESEALSSSTQTWTSTVSAGSGFNYASYSAQSNVYYKTTFHYVEDHMQCADTQAHSLTYYYQTVNKGWTQGTTSERVTKAPYAAPYCVPEDAHGGTLFVDKSTAVTWSNGLVIEGLALSTSSGYTTDTKATFTWPASRSMASPNRWCGKDAYPNEKGSYIAIQKGV